MTWAGKQSEQPRAFQSPETYLLLTFPFIERGYRKLEVLGLDLSGNPTPQKLFVLSGRGLDDLESQLGGLPLELLDL